MIELQPMHGLALFVAGVAGLAVAHRVVLRLPIGLPRLVVILPLLPIFFMLPWTIPIYHLRGMLSFIFLWTVPSKLLLLCWDAGIDYPSSGFLYFATIIMMPIRVKGRKEEKQAPSQTHRGPFWWQFIAVILILNIYSYRNGLPLWAIYVLYTCHIYLGLELMLGGLAKLATACFGVESDPQFDNPFMSASLSEFWGRRWNLVVTTILRSTVYNPALLLLARVEKHKAQQLSAQTGSSTTRTPLLSQARDLHENMSVNGNIKSYQNGIATHGDTQGKQVATKILQPKPMLQMHEVEAVERLSSSIGSDNAEANYNQAVEKSSTNHAINPNSNYRVTNLSKTIVAASTTKILDMPLSYLSCDESNSVMKAKCISRFDQGPATPCSNPKIRPQNGDVMKPTLRARTIAMLTRAAKQKNNETRATSNDAKLELKTAKVDEMEDGGKGEQSSGEKPSLRARAVAMMVTFAVSGLVHELIFYYFNKSKATWEVTAFFLLHGCATATEVLLKKTMLAHLHLPRPISIVLTLAFLYATAAWLFMPALTRYGADINTIAEYQQLQSAVLALFTQNASSSH